MKTRVACLLLFALSLGARPVDPLDGLWQGYDGEWRHVSNQLVTLAEAIPADKFEWRPTPGVRSIREVILHIAQANFWLVSITGTPVPSDVPLATLEKSVTDKEAVIRLLRRSLEIVKNAHAHSSEAELKRSAVVSQRPATVDGIYLRILVHANEHMGQLIAYARVNGIVPPWSEGKAK